MVISNRITQYCLINSNSSNSTGRNSGTSRNYLSTNNSSGGGRDGISDSNISNTFSDSISKGTFKVSTNTRRNTTHSKTTFSPLFPRNLSRPRRQFRGTVKPAAGRGLLLSLCWPRYCPAVLVLVLAFVLALTVSRTMSL